jgi:citrate synthase
MPKPERPTSALCDHDEAAVRYRGRDLVEELIGKLSFTEVLMLQILGRLPGAPERRMMDAILVTLMEHGLTPSAITTRLVYHSAPEAMQGAVAAGLLAVGSQFVGTMENAALLLREIREDPAGLEPAARRVAESYRAERRAIPGFGHHLHKPDDPRAKRLLELAREEGQAGSQVEALEILGHAVDAAAGRHVTVNATGAIAAILGDMGVPPELMRGFALVSRAAGLVSHVGEERERPSARFIWDLVEGAIPSEGGKRR